MPDQINFELVSPAKLLISAPVDMVVVPGVDGDFGVLDGHTPLISTVRPGVIDVHEGGRVSSRIFVAGGFAEVTGTRVTVLAEEAMPVADITAEMASARLSAAKEKITDANTDSEKQAAETMMAVALAMKDAAG
ncbi:ATP synthase F1 subunit epsilon [Magnetospirillum sp. UT-4]|uniref:ATP synthase F1 subunit epsilon n=1 Tax=Magnetospirillum sp. UT-4 TaxID=2681467 RepID=UPI0013829220|nr:ATP synthase F1 subunit epsilon [Magnetospirillum sp. UT-4]CAA7623493.1 ATP synthase epsilon chain [Magnetospirillum sp. UT-4]